MDNTSIYIGSEDKEIVFENIECLSCVGGIFYLYFSAGSLINIKFKSIKVLFRNQFIL